MRKVEDYDESDTLYPLAYKAKAVTKIARNIYMIQATLRHNTLWKASRTMIVIRQQEELTLINAVRLNKDGEDLLQRLGYVSRVIRLGTTTTHHHHHHHGGTGSRHRRSSSSSHSRFIATDHDMHYKISHGAEIWAPGITDSYQAPIDVIINQHSVLPFRNSTLFLFQNSLIPEAAIFIQVPSERTERRRDSANVDSNGGGGGLLITSEALQNQLDNEFLSLSSRTAMSLMGMFQSTTVIPPKWLKLQEKQGCDKLAMLRDDFERLLRLDFSRHVGAKGTVVYEKAKQEVVVAVEMAFPVW